MNQTDIKPFTFFDKKLGLAMELADISNIQLSKKINVDPSLISRFRSGHRTPKSNPKLVTNICQTLLNRINHQNKTRELLQLIGVPEHVLSGEDTLFLSFQNWLCDYQSDDAGAIQNLLGTVNDFSFTQKLDLLPPSSIITEKILNEQNTIYQGKVGIQRAVLRFLGQVIDSHAPEIFLYSDENMEWIIDSSFQLKWLSLMSACMRQGTKIKIIHNIGRSIAEMTSAIMSWLPLYMSGLIESYYSIEKLGSRFSHTLFLCPDVACVSSFSPQNIGKKNLYNYISDKVHLEFYKTCYDLMLEDCKLLVHTQNNDTTSLRTDSKIEQEQLFENISINLNDFSVSVICKDRPRIAFTFYHPLMVDAFHTFCHQQKIVD